MVIALALAFSLSAIVTVYLIFRIGDTRVPPVVGKTEVEAIRMAEKAGLKAKVQKRSDPTTPENVVIETRPAPNSSVKKDSNVTIVVSSGPSQNRSQIRVAPGGTGPFSAIGPVILDEMSCNLRAVAGGFQPLKWSAGWVFHL